MQEEAWTGTHGNYSQRFLPTIAFDQLDDVLALNKARNHVEFHLPCLSFSHQALSSLVRDQSSFLSVPQRPAYVASS